MKGYSVFVLLALVACTQPKTQYNTTADPKEGATTEEPTPMEEGDATTSTETEHLVYVTQAGDKYHTADCRYSKAAQTVTLGKAKADGLTACGICKPNSKTGEKQLRCTATTTEGKRCQRMTTDTSGKCFQHRES